MWPDMMFEAMDSVAIDTIPRTNNRKAISLVYIIFIFITTFFIMNLFISVIVDEFNDDIKRRLGEYNFNHEQKEWVKLQRFLVNMQPKIIPIEPIN